MSKAGTPVEAHAGAAPGRPSKGSGVSGETVATMSASTLSTPAAAIARRLASAAMIDVVIPEATLRRSRIPGPLQDPRVGRFDQRLEVGVGDDLVGTEDAMPRIAVVLTGAWGWFANGAGRRGAKDRHLDRAQATSRGYVTDPSVVRFAVEMLASLVAVKDPFPFSISGFTGLTIPRSSRSSIVFVLFNVLVVLHGDRPGGPRLHLQAEPRDDRFRGDAGTSTLPLLRCLMAFIGTVLGSSAERTWLILGTPWPPSGGRPARHQRVHQPGFALCRRPM